MVEDREVPAGPVKAAEKVETVGFAQRVMLAWAVVGVVLLAVAVLFPVLYVQDQNQWNYQWQGSCDERGHLLESGFRQSFKLVDVLARTMERFYVWPDPPQIDQDGFKDYLQGIISGTFMGNCVVMRYITDKQRPKYEAERGELIHMVTKEPPGPDRLHPIPELVQDKTTEWLIGMAMDHTFDSVYTVDDIVRSAETGVVALSPPVHAAGLYLTTTAVQYIFVAGQPLYLKELATNATPEERLGNFSAMFAVNFDIWSIVEGITNDLQGGRTLVLKLVDVTDEQQPPMPLYIPALEIASTHGNWTFADYGFKMSLRFGGTDRHYEIWCRPAPGNSFFPMRAVGYSAAILLLGLSAAQVLWVHAKSISVSEARYLDALRLKDEMALAKKASDDHSAAKSAFVASVSHEIRTPMNGVLGMLGLLIDTTELTPVQDDFARTALSSGRALLSLVSDILDLSKIESCCMELETIPFSPTDEMDGIVSMFGERSRGKNLELSSLVQPSVPPMVMGDPARFRQIIINLVSNSLKFCNHGHIFVRIAAVLEDDALPEILRRFHAGHLIGGINSSQTEEGQRESQDHRGQTLSGCEVCDVDCCWPSIKAASEEDAAAFADRPGPTASDSMRLLVWVEDSGIGIPDLAMDRIFNPFMQADKSTARIYGGTGIGLNISRKLVELMSGELDFTSSVDKGTTFRFNIKVQSSPLHRPASGNSSATLPELPLSDPALDPSTVTVLVIDNNALRAEITCSYFRRMGMSARASVLPFPSLRSGRDSLTHQSSEESTAESCAPETPPHPDIVFLELEPSGGEWAHEGSAHSLSSSGSNKSGTPESLLKRTKMPASPMRASGLEQRLPWARGVAGLGEKDGRAGKEVPVILLSNTQDAAVKAEAERVGFASVVLKPLRKATLVACLQGALGRERMGRLRLLGGEISQSVEGGASCISTLAGKEILVVDDNAVNRKVAGKLLEMYGFVVTCKASGEDALKVLMGKHNFDLVFADIQMPGMDGYEMTKAIRTAESEGLSRGPWCAWAAGVPIFAMTADVMKGSMERFAEVGMCGMIPKPIEGPRLLQVIEESLSNAVIVPRPSVD